MRIWTKRSLVIAVVIGALVASCGDGVQHHEREPGLDLGRSTESPRGESFFSVPEGFELDVSGDHWQQSPMGLLAAVDEIVAAGGSLISGQIVAVVGNPADVTIGFADVLAGGTVEARTATVAVTAVDHADLPSTGRAVAVLDQDETTVMLALAISENPQEWFDVGAIGVLRLGAALNASVRLAIPAACGAEAVDGGESTLDALVEYIKTRPSRDQYVARVALADRAVQLSSEHGYVEGRPGDGMVPVDHLDLHRQLAAGIPEAQLTYGPTMPIQLTGTMGASGSLVFVDELTGRQLGLASDDDRPRTLFIGVPSEGSSLLVYADWDSRLTCDSILPDAQATSVVALGSVPVAAVGPGWIESRHVTIDPRTGDLSGAYR